MVDLAEVGARFGERLRAAGVGVTPEKVGRFVRAVALVAPVGLGELRAIGRLTLVSSAAERDVFDAVFAEVFGGLDDVAERRGDPTAPGVRRGGRPPAPGARATAAPTTGGNGVAGNEGDQDSGELRPHLVAAAASRSERLATTDFAELTDEELRELYATMRSIRLAVPPRTGHRHRRHRHGDRLDLRATVRRSRRTGGEPIDHVTRRRRPQPRRLVVLCDISGSMAPYSRAFVQFLHATARGTEAEVFTFATRLTRVTRALAVRQPDLALARAAAAAEDWRGGTRIGDAVKTFLDEHGRRGMARGAVVVIVSDGWDRSDPGLLGEQMSRLGRLAHRVVWINPRRAAPGYEPLAGGMAEALPHCDAFVGGHTLTALRSAVTALAG